MVDFSAVEGFDWDEGNVNKSLDKHRVAPAEAEQVFSGNPLIAADIKHSENEQRFQALGTSFDGRMLHVTFTLRKAGKKLRIISARDMSRRERAFYEQEA
jgi:uncharacterized DUF497 family protein